MDSSQNQRSIVSVRSEPDPCPICKGEVMDRALTDTCLHEFCLKCLKDWSEIPHNTCPVCRQTYRNIISNIKSNDVFDQIFVTKFDLSFIESVSEEIINEYETSTHSEEILALHSDRPYGAVGASIEQIFAGNPSFLDAVIEHKRICDCPHCVLSDTSDLSDICKSFQNILLAFTQFVVNKMVDDITENMSEELLLSILKYKRQEFVDFLTDVIQNVKQLDTDSTDLDSTVTVVPPDSQYDSNHLDSGSEEQNEDNRDSDGQTDDKV